VSWFNISVSGVNISVSGLNYITVSTPMTESQANVMCSRDYGGTLAMVKSPGDQSSLETTMINSGFGEALLGASRENLFPYSWKWVTGMHFRYSLQSICYIFFILSAGSV
jgi:hypothetical protein